MIVIPRFFFLNNSLGIPLPHNNREPYLGNEILCSCSRFCHHGALGLSVNFRALEIKELWIKMLEIYL